jgi:hypothetical protein
VIKIYILLDENEKFLGITTNSSMAEGWRATGGKVGEYSIEIKDRVVTAV